MKQQLETASELDAAVVLVVVPRGFKGRLPQHRVERFEADRSASTGWGDELTPGGITLYTAQILG